MHLIEHFFVILHGGLAQDVREVCVRLLHLLLVAQQIGVVTVDRVLEHRGLVEPL